MPEAKLLAMLAKQGIEGDDALLRLAQARLQDAGLGGELYPETPGQLEAFLEFRPQALPCTAHLPRHLNLLHAEARTRIGEFAGRCAGRVAGLIVHDHAQFAGNPTETVDIQEMVCRMAVSNASGKVLWHQDRASRMRSWGSVNQGGSASQQLRDEMVNGFKSLLASSGAATEAVPRYIFANLDTILAGESTLGFRNEGPPPQLQLPGGQVKKEPGIAPGS